MFPSISFPLGSIGSFNAGALRSTVVTRFNATTAPSDSCPNIRPGRSPKFLCRTIRTRHPTLPRHAPPFRCTILVQGRVLASCHLKHWPHGTCVTRLYPWIHFRYGSYICEREASPCRSPFTMPASLLMQWSIHKANTFQFASSAKLRLAHRKTQKGTKSSTGAASVCVVYCGYTPLPISVGRVRSGCRIARREQPRLPRRHGRGARARCRLQAPGRARGSAGRGAL